ncbi:MAG: glycoside-pentoside-hexuronide (GPH):cation symporter [Clostridia bacterium]
MAASKLRFREKLSYGVGALGKDFYAGLFSTYLMIYFTDVFGIGAAAVGTLIIIARIWDAVNDPIMGMVVDKTDTRMGKFRPYLLVVPVVMGAAMIGLFTVPELGYAGKLAWAYFFYILAGMCFTAYDVPIMSMAPAISNIPQERTSLLTFSRFFTYLGAMSVAIVAMPAVKALGGGNDARGYQLFVAILVAIAIAAAWTTFFNTKERVVVKGARIGLKDYKHLLMNNKPLLIIIFAVILTATGQSIVGSVSLYFFTYVLGRPDLIPLFMGTGALVILVLPFVPAITRRFGKIKTTKAVLVYQILLGSVSFIVYMTAGANLYYVLFVAISTTICTALPLVTTISMVADTVDYGEFKTGVRSEGLIFSMNSFALKVGMALASGVAGYVLAISGYVPNVDQTWLARTGIIALMTIIPVLFNVLFYIILTKYDLTEDKAMAYSLELEKRKKMEP